MTSFQQVFEKWLRAEITEETNPRRREILEKGLSHGTVEFLRSVWFPAVGNLDHMHPEWEVRDFNNGYRYLDLAYMPGGAQGTIEVQDYRSHARDLGIRRFKDLCMRHSLLSLDDWTFLLVAFLSIIEEPKLCQQLVLSFIGKFVSTTVRSELPWLDAECVRFARRKLRPLTTAEFAEHLRVSDRHIRRILHRLVDRQILCVASGKQRIRTYKLRE